KDILLVQIYVDDIIFGATNKALCQSFNKLMKDKFQMSSMGELTFFLGLQFLLPVHFNAVLPLIFLDSILGFELTMQDVCVEIRITARLSSYRCQANSDAVVAAIVEEIVVEDVSYDAIPSPPSHDIPSPSQEPSSPPQQPHVTPSAPTQGETFPTNFQQVLDTCSALIRHVEHLKLDNVAQKLEIVKLKARVKKLEKTNNVKSSKFRCLRKVGASRRVESSAEMEDVFNQGRMINEDKGFELVKDADIADTKGRQADKQAEIYNIDLDQSSKVLSMQEDDSEVQDVVEPSIPAAAPTVVAAYTRRRKREIIRDPEEELSLKTFAETPAETPKVKDKGKCIMVETPKPMKKKDQIELDAEYVRKLHEEINKDDAEFNKDIDWDAAMDHTESEARKNMMIYLKNTTGYKMDFFKGMSYADICLIFQARFDENMRFLFKSREEMEEEDEEIIKSINETPTQKAAKRRKLNKEAQEAEALKKQLEIVNDEDDDVFTEATPLARKVLVVDYEIVMINNKPRYPLSKFTLEQLVNMARLQVEEESEMSLELLRFTKQQLQEYQ
nr:putative ribonuclease H-like domain-containing protein [Tanacetum cinerariifolium]